MRLEIGVFCDQILYEGFLQLPKDFHQFFFFACQLFHTGIVSED
jgi:hypothetical protein